MDTAGEGHSRQEPQTLMRVEQADTATVPRHLAKILALHDFEAIARRKLPRQIYGYYSGGAETNLSVQENLASFRSLTFVPRVLADVGSRKTTTTLFGREYAAPFGISPMGLSGLSTFDGDAVLARAARAEGIFAITSATSVAPLEHIAATGGARWFQAYLPGEDDRIEAMVDRVAAAGYETLVLTVDVPVPANRENNVRTGFSIPLKPSLRLAFDGLTHPGWLVSTWAKTLLQKGMPHFENMDAFRGPPILSSNVVRAIGKRDRLSWRHVELIRKRWRGTFVIKGILAAEDACSAREHGADGIIVSNHGGRQLDGACAPLDVLPGIADVAGGMSVMLDGGVRRGSDVLKALALGANFVFVGRPFLFAAAAAGESGVRHGVSLLKQEIDRNMALLGISSLEQARQIQLKHKAL